MTAVWREFALCKGTPIDWWYPAGADLNWARPDRTPRRLRAEVIHPEAAARCDACPARSACLDWALHHERHGIWAGTTGQQREAMRHAAGIDLDTPGAQEPAEVVAGLLDDGVPPPHRWRARREPPHRLPMGRPTAA